MAFCKMTFADEFYFNEDFTYFSLVPLEGYRNWTQLFESQYKGYKFNMEHLSLENAEHPILNYEKLMALFASKDLESKEV